MLPSDRRSLVTRIVRLVVEREMYSMNPWAVKRAQSGNSAASLTVIRKIPRGASASTSNRHSVKLYMTGPSVTTSLPTRVSPFLCRRIELAVETGLVEALRRAPAALEEVPLDVAVRLDRDQEIEHAAIGVHGKPRSPDRSWTRG